MTWLTDRIAAVLAENVVALVPAPTGELGYGTDLACIDDVEWREVDPNSFEGIGHHAYRMLTTDRDSIPDAPGRGYNIVRLLNRGMTQLELRAQEGLIRAEVLQDDRIDTCDVDVSITQKTIRIVLRITPFDPKVKAFDLIIAIAESGEVMIERLAAT